MTMLSRIAIGLLLLVLALPAAAWRWEEADDKVFGIITRGTWDASRGAVLENDEMTVIVIPKERRMIGSVSILEFVNYDFLYSISTDTWMEIVEDARSSRQCFPHQVTGADRSTSRKTPEQARQLSERRESDR